MAGDHQARKRSSLSSISVVVLACVLLLPAIPRFAGSETLDSAFVLTRDSVFVLDGRPFHFAGTNSYYLMTYAADPSLRHEVNEVLSEAALMGLTVVRTWAFNDGDGWNALQTAPGVYDEAVFRGLDHVLDRCSQLGLRVVLPLVNNWVDYGGMDQYVAWSATASFHDDFYTDPDCRAWYRDHAAAVIGRVNTVNGRMYRDDPTILAWELANEPRCASDPSGNTLQRWLEEMSAFVQGLDANHLVGTGSEGFYQDPGSGDWYLDGSEGVDYLRNHQAIGIDFAGAHSWPDDWGLDPETALSLMARQIVDAGLFLEKPYVLGEFGKFRDGVAAPHSRAHYDPATYFSPGVKPYAVPGARPLTSADDRLPRPPPPAAAMNRRSRLDRTSTAARDRFFSDTFNLLVGDAAGGGMFWASYHDTYPDYDGFGVYHPADTSTVELITAFAAEMNSLGLPGFAGPVLLGRAYPNPFTSQLTIPLSVEDPSGGTSVQVIVFDARGRQIRVLREGYLQNGDYAIPWSGGGFRSTLLPAGVYFFSVRSGNRRWSGQAIRIP